MHSLHRILQKWLYIIPFLATFSAWFCFYIQFTIELRALVTIFFAGVFFAFAITMNTANVRRFQALDDIALLKSLLLSLWQTSNAHLDDTKLAKLKNELSSFFSHLQGFLTQENSSMAGHELKTIDDFFKTLVLTIEELRDAGMPAPEISRVLQWHQQGYFAFEKLLTIKESRTPLSLRLFMSLALIVSLFILAPQFALFGHYGIVSAAIVSTVMVSLISIQNKLEQPFGKDLDDISFAFSDRMINRIN